jgi:arylsulfatase A-like enzyme
VPAVFGMNFQAVSVGQKLAKDNADGSCVEDTDPLLNGQPGGYLDGSGTPSNVLAYGLDKTDQALQSMIDALKQQGIYDSTLFIVTAKHGQSPINPVKLNKVGHLGDLVATLPGAATDPAAQAVIGAANCGTGPCGAISDDDVALIWLADQSQGAAVASYLNTNAKALAIEQVMAGLELRLRFNNPLKDSRTPDIIVQPTYGTIYTTSGKKVAEHGGFSYGDANVGLIVANPRLRGGRVLKTPVSTSQVAPTILQALGLDPEALTAVRTERTVVLPGLSR